MIVYFSFLATANIDSGAALYDVRQPNQPCVQYKLGTLARRKEHVTHITFNSSGSQVLVQIREHDPLLFEASSGEPICRFFHLEMKNRVGKHEQKGCFLGMDDEYIAVGSEDFRIYVWKVPPRSSNSLSTCSNEMLDLCHMPHLVLPGHRSIVSKLLFSKKNQFLFSAGVEKMVKVWSPWKLPSSVSEKHSSHGHICRPHYSRWQYIELLMTNGRLSPQLVPSEPHELTLEEDLVVMAFYDVLIDDFTNNSVFFYFTADETEASAPYDSSQQEDIHNPSSLYAPSSYLMSDTSPGTSYTTESFSGGYTVGEDDSIYDSDAGEDIW